MRAPVPQQQTNLRVSIMCTDCSVVNHSDLASASVRTTISYAVAAKSLQTTRQVGEALVGMLEDSVQLAKEAGKGEQFEAIA